MLRFFQTLEIIFFLIWFPLSALAAHEISIENVFVKEHPPHHYDVTADYANNTRETREVTIRCQVVFYDKASPQGDIPVMTLRKDETFILKRSERREITVRLIHEGNFPKGALRVVPQARLRRQRIWNY